MPSRRFLPPVRCHRKLEKTRTFELWSTKVDPLSLPQRMCACDCQVFGERINKRTWKQRKTRKRGETNCQVLGIRWRPLRQSVCLSVCVWSLQEKWEVGGKLIKQTKNDSHQEKKRKPKESDGDKVSDKRRRRRCTEVPLSMAQLLPETKGGRGREESSNSETDSPSVEFSRASAGALDKCSACLN